MRQKKVKVETELDKAQKQFDAFDEQVKNLTMDRMNEAPKAEVEKQTKLSQNEINNQNGTYLKPIRTIGSREKFNERFREKYNFAKEYVNFIAENREIVGEEIEIWTKKFPGVPAEYWKVPVNKPVWGPRYLAEQIKSKYYHRLKTENTTVSGDHAGEYYGAMVVDTTIPRLDAFPVSNKKSVFMGSTK
jgi:hypothetical protein